MLFGDLTFIIGTVVVILYVIFSLCISVIKYTARTRQMGEQIRRYEGDIGRLQVRIQELQEERTGISPQLDQLVAQMLERRSRRDKLQIGYKEMQETVLTRQIDIRSRA